MANQIVQRDNAVAPVQEETALLSMIERAATNPDVDIEKMERLWAMHEKACAKRAEQEFAEAMVAAQAEMTRISADAVNPQTKSRYATYARLDAVLRPIYTKHGFSVSFNTGEAPEDAVRVYAYVSHEAGHTREYQVLMPADGKGAKGGAVMTKTHATASGMSYGMRYLLKMIFNVAVGEDDDDGNRAAASEETVTLDEAMSIEALIQEVGADKEKFLQWLGVSSLSEMPARHFKTAVKALEKKRAE